MKKIWMIVVVCALNSAAWAADAPVGVTPTVKISGIKVAADQILITPKPDYMHILWDAFPERVAIQAAGKSFSLKLAALDLVKGPGLEKSPQTKMFKVDIVDFFEKDSYGAKRWDKVKFLGRYEVTFKNEKWIVNKRENK